MFRGLSQMAGAGSSGFWKKDVGRAVSGSVGTHLMAHALAVLDRDSASPS